MMYFESVVVLVLFSIQCICSRLPLEVFQHHPIEHYVHHHRLNHNAGFHRKKNIDFDNVKILYQIGVSIFVHLKFKTTFSYFMGDFTQSTGNTTVVTYPKKQFVCLCCGHSRSQILRKKKTKPAVPHRIFIIQILSNYQKKNRDFTNIRNHFFQR